MLIVCSLTTSGEVLVTRKSYLDYLKTVGLKNTNKLPRGLKQNLEVNVCLCAVTGEVLATRKQNVVLLKLLIGQNNLKIHITILN